MKFHALKSHPRPFASVESGVKRFEIRKDDRNFQKGDIVWLREFVANAEEIRAWRRARGDYSLSPEAGYTGANAGPFMIGYVERTPGCVPDGYCGFDLIPLVKEGGDQ